MRFLRWDIERVIFVCTETYALDWIHESGSQILGKPIPTLPKISNTIKSFLPTPEQNHRQERIL